MKFYSLAFARVGVLVVLTSLAGGCADGTLPATLRKECLSTSGLSHYLIDLDVTSKNGTIGYRYMEQEVRYRVLKLTVDGSSLNGRAEFQSSATGEIRGAPIYFTFDNETGTFTDGDVSARCVDWHENEIH